MLRTCVFYDFYDHNLIYVVCATWYYTVGFQEVMTFLIGPHAKMRILHVEQCVYAILICIVDQWRSRLRFWVILVTSNNNFPYYFKTVILQLISIRNCSRCFPFANLQIFFNIKGKFVLNYQIASSLTENKFCSYSQSLGLMNNT